MPQGFSNALEAVVEFIRDTIVQPNVGQQVGAHVWTPLLLTLFVFILTANVVGLIPIFDVLALLNHTVLHLPEDSFLTKLTHGGMTATGNFNVTAGLATVTFFAIIIAGIRAHGFVQALEEHGAARAADPDLLPADSRSRSWACSSGRSRSRCDLPPT